MTAFILFHPFQIFAQTLPSQKKFIQIPVRCSLNSLQLTNPIDMNTVIVGAMVKTIHVEKEVYACTDPPAIYDQDIYIKKIEDLAKFPNVTSSTTFEVVTCAKNNLTGDVLGCVKKIPHQYSPINIHCQQTFIGFPMQLNTVVAPNGIVKTVEAQKEVFGCPTSVSPKFMKDVTIFTEIFENVAKHTENSTFDSVVCTRLQVT